MTPKLIGLALAAAATAPSAGLTVDITSPANHSRVPWRSQVPYAATVTYDGKSTKFGELPASAVVVRATYMANADAPMRVEPLPQALVEISRSNCSGCHDFTASSAGPAFAAIGKRYAGHGGAVAMLADHIRNGSHGAWGGGSMPPHPDITPAQAQAIAQWLVSQAANPAIQYAIGKSGSFRMTAAGKPGPHAGMVVTAFYSGALKGSASRTPEAGHNTVVVYGSGS